MKKNSKKKIWLGIFIVLFYFVANDIQTLLFTSFDIDFYELPLWFRVAYSFTFQIVELGTIILLLKDELKKDVIDLKKNHKNYFKTYFKYWFLLLGLMVISNLFIMLLTPNDIANNEEAIRTSFQVTPIYMFLSAVFIAPFLEELIFRQGIRNIYSNNLCFILVSGLLFGSLHVITSLTSTWQLFYIIPYSIPGFVFAYLLVKTDNVLVPASMHFMHNGILMSLQMLLLLLG